MQTLRTLLELSSTDEDKIKLYQQAKELLAGLPGSAYPDRELQWLVSTCWNRGAHQAKFLRCEAAERYMRLALGLLEHCHSLSGRKQVGVILLLLHSQTSRKAQYCCMAALVGPFIRCILLQYIDAAVSLQCHSNPRTADATLTDVSRPQMRLPACSLALRPLAGNATVCSVMLQMMVDELNKVVQKRAGQAETGAPSTSSPKERKRKRNEAEVTTNISLAALKQGPE